MMLYRKGYKAPFWRAPELLRGEPPSKASDVYAYGILLYEVLYRREPFEKENKEVCNASLLWGLCCSGLSVLTCQSKLEGLDLPVKAWLAPRLGLP